MFNYIAHAATVKSVPGETWRQSTIKALLAFFAPFSGIWNACIAIARSKILEESKLNHALRTQALCAVVRTHKWRPEAGTTVLGCHTSGICSGPEGGFQRGMLRVNPLYDAGQQPRVLSPKTENIHGQAVLPAGGAYELQLLPKYVTVAPFHDRPRDGKPEDTWEVDLCCSYNFVKSSVSLLQLVFASLTFYRARGAEIDRFGYAAFGVTVIPYAIMSLVNLIANVTTPDYPYLYLVRSEVMEEAESRGGRFDGVIGKIVMPEDRGQSHDLPITTVSAEPEGVGRTPSIEGFEDKLATGIEIGFWDSGDLEGDLKNNPTVTVPAAGQYVFKGQTMAATGRENFALLTGLIAVLAPWAIIGGWTMFQGADSTIAERGWILAWLGCGEVFGLCLGYISVFGEGFVAREWDIPLKVMLLVVCGVPVVGGFVVVGQMLSAFGVCVT